MKKDQVQSLAPLIEEGERVLKEAINFFALKTTPESITVTIQTKGRKNAVGWYWAGRWVSGKGTKKDVKAHNEINMSAEHLVDHDMGELLLHELAHAENNTCGTKDCSGRVHNKHFKSMAERLGLEVKPRDKSVGYGYTDLAQAGKDFLKKIAFKRELFTSYRPPQSGKSATGGRLLKLECGGCGYVIRSTQKWIDTGTPTCACGDEFHVA
jgi:hypothetical protein